jgi:hypothetical protein
MLGIGIFFADCPDGWIRISNLARMFEEGRKNGSRLWGYDEPMQKCLDNIDAELAGNADMKLEILSYCLGFARGWNYI